MAVCISVIIPAYNGARFLDATLTSVCAQTYADWELLCVDDGSTDATPEIVRAWMERDPRIQYIRRENPGGSACPARNEGYRRSNPASLYLLFLDQDDLLKPDALERLKAALECNPDCNGVHGLAEYIDAEGRVLGRQTPDSRREARVGRAASLSTEEPTTFDTLAMRCCIEAPGCLLARRSAFEGRSPFPDDDPMALDWDGWLLLTRQRPLRFLPEITLSYRHTSHGMSHDKRKLRLRTMATRWRVACSPLFTEAQRATILRAAGINERAHAGEKFGFALGALRALRLKETARQLAYCVRHLGRGWRYSREAERFLRGGLERACQANGREPSEARSERSALS